jgi:hypothetical protein
MHHKTMSLPRPLPCAFYRTTTGNEPVREWLKALPEGERKQVGSDIIPSAFDILTLHWSAVR